MQVNAETKHSEEVITKKKRKKQRKEIPPAPLIEKKIIKEKKKFFPLYPPKGERKENNEIEKTVEVNAIYATEVSLEVKCAGGNSAPLKSYRLKPTRKCLKPIHENIILPSSLEGNEKIGALRIATPQDADVFHSLRSLIQHKIFVLLKRIRRQQSQFATH